MTYNAHVFLHIIDTHNTCRCFIYIQKYILKYFYTLPHLLSPKKHLQTCNTHLPGKRMSSLKGLNSVKIQSNVSLPATGYIETVDEKWIDLPHWNSAVKPCQVLHLTGKKTFMQGVPRTTQNLFRAGPKLCAESCETGFPLLLHTGTKSKQVANSNIKL